VIEDFGFSQDCQNASGTGAARYAKDKRFLPNLQRARFAAKPVGLAEILYALASLRIEHMVEVELAARWMPPLDSPRERFGTRCSFRRFGASSFSRFFAEPTTWTLPATIFAQPQHWWQERRGSTGGLGYRFSRRGDRPPARMMSFSLLQGRAAFASAEDLEMRLAALLHCAAGRAADPALTLRVFAAAYC